MEFSKVSITDFKTNSNATLDRVLSKNETIIVTKHNQPTVAIVSLDRFKEMDLNKSFANLNIKESSQIGMEQGSLVRTFNHIGEYVCKIQAVGKSCSGIVLDNRIIAVPFHVVGSLENNDDCPIESIIVFYKDEKYTASWCSYSFDNNNWSPCDPEQDTSRVSKCRDHDICFFMIDSDSFPKTSLLPADSPVEDDLFPGEEVYYAAFHLEGAQLSFHKGCVSAVDDVKCTSIFSIDGTVLPGSSGGPVFIKRDQQLRLLGMIIAEHAIINPTFAKKKDDMLAILDRSAPLENSNNDNADHLSDTTNSVLINLVNTMFDNFSTGIGKVIHAKHIYTLFLKDDGRDCREVPSPFHSLGLSTSRGEKTTYEQDGITYPTYSDNHGGKKHKIAPKKYNQRNKNEREFCKKTKHTPATFLPQVFEQPQYGSLDAFVAACIKTWVESGARQSQPYVKFSENIGADNGQWTNYVEIYGDPELGYHARPKYLTPQQEKAFDDAK